MLLFDAIPVIDRYPVYIILCRNIDHRQPEYGRKSYNRLSYLCSLADDNVSMIWA